MYILICNLYLCSIKVLSLSLCKVVYLETLQNYRQNGSQVFSCLLDASKAFDRMHYVKLFNMLIDRKLPNRQILFFVFYLKGTIGNNLELCRIHVRYTDYFCMSNGVK